MQGPQAFSIILAPRFLGVRVVLARSFARIHKSNLINFGIVPLLLPGPGAVSGLEPGILLEFPDLRREVEKGIPVSVIVPGGAFKARLEVTEREKALLLAGGLLNQLREGAGS